MTDRLDTASAVGEEAIVQTYLAPLAAAYAGAFGLRDDCAALSPPPGHDIVVKTDPIREGVHFFADDTPADIGWKALAVNVSDLVAKGATPLAYVVALSFPHPPRRQWMTGFAEGLRDAQSAFGCHLIGGDTDRADGPMTIAVTAFGIVPNGRMVRRATAQVGDSIYVTGDLGASALGLRLRRNDAAARTWPLDETMRHSLIGRYLRPHPSRAIASLVLTHAHASMDLSDGLHKDVDRLCRASGVGCRIDLTSLPLADATRAVTSALPAVLPLVWSAGDDYQVLCTVPPDRRQIFEADARNAALAVTRIGVITADTAVRLLDATGTAVAGPPAGWDHF